jgi:hypothetical protein
MAKRLDSGIWSGSVGLLDTFDSKYQRGMPFEAFSALEGLPAFDIFRAVDPVQVLVKNVNKHFQMSMIGESALKRITPHFDNFFYAMEDLFQDMGLTYDNDFMPPPGEEMRQYSMDVYSVC